MVDLRTKVTELGTGLGTLGYPGIEEALAARPRQMLSVSPELWQELDAAYQGGRFNKEFESAFANGRALLDANDGLRGRIPESIEWKGGQRNPGDDSLPIDLRIDHVFLVSCKYNSKVLHNGSPSRVFTGGLRTAGGTSGDWYQDVAVDEYRAFYSATLVELGITHLPRDPWELTTAFRKELKNAFPARWPSRVDDLYGEMSARVAGESSQRWRASLPDRGAKERFIWRLLRLGQAPYYVLGANTKGGVRRRIATPWDWQQRFVLRSFEVSPRPSQQPVVNWQATVTGKNDGRQWSVEGYVEIRWSHGRFQSPPEAKVQLVTPPNMVPGYFSLQ